MNKQEKSAKINVDSVISRMTLEEKAAMVCGATFFGMNGAERLGVPSLMLLDGGTGINFEQLFGDFYSRQEVESNSTNGMVGSTVLTRVIDNFYHPENLSGDEIAVHQWIKGRLRAITGGDYSPGCYPPGILLGASFDPDTVRRVGEVLGREARLFGINILLGTPNVNIHRDPLNGRLFEGYSEDPCLVSTLAPELVKGVQQAGVAANVKHFAANNQETERVGINETISARALQEIYLPGFRACVTEGGVKTVMSAYNAINGTPCSENHWLLTEILRDDWGFEGAVVSDWGAVYHPVEALAAGNDLAMPGPISPQPIIDAVRDGRMSEDTLDLAVSRLLNIIGFCMENVSDKENDFERLRRDSDKAAYDAALSGIVMLKNSGGLYPLAPDGRRVFIVGSGAREMLMCGTGSAGITTDRSSDLAQTLREGLPGTEVAVLDEYVRDIPSGSRVIYVANVGGMEGNDRPDMLLPEEDRTALERLCLLKKQQQFSLTLVLNVCGPVDFFAYEESLDVVFVCFLPGMEGAHALGDLMTGKGNPSGRLPLTWPRRYEDTPTFLNFPGEGREVNYGEGIYVGYRYYDKKRIRPAYPFGFGLGYSSFELSDLKLEAAEFSGELRGSVAVTNVGDREGAEVVQIYVSDPVSTLPKPVKELKFFEKVHLNPGQSRRVDFVLKEKDFASFDPRYDMWLAEEGYYDIIAATSSAPEDEWARQRAYLNIRNQYSYGMGTSVKVLYEKKELRALLEILWEKNNWDWQIVESNYQYTPSRLLSEILPGQPDKKSAEEFTKKAAEIRRE